VIEIFTDGGCRPNPGVGAWAAILLWKGHMRELTGSERGTTNNRMEMMAVIKGLGAIKKPNQKITVYTDSKYVQQGITSWIKKWKKNGWKTTQNTPVKNEDLWKKMDRLLGEHDVTFRWIKGHNDNPLNERADALCTQSINREYGGVYV